MSKRVPAPQEETIADGLTYRDALKLRDEWTARLAAEEPQWQGCMCRSIAGIELTNGQEVKRILGYGPDFCLERAAVAVAKVRNASRL